VEQEMTRWQLFRAELKFTRSSLLVVGGFFLTVGLVVFLWWPLVDQYFSYIFSYGIWWKRFDWLLLGIFLFMLFFMSIGANIRKDAVTIFVGLYGGYLIESWGTRTEIWSYFSNERPPLWIIPAWPIATLAIYRIVNFFDVVQLQDRNGLYRFLYWIIFLAFFAQMVYFVRPSFSQPFTWIALSICLFLILTPTNHRFAVFLFVAGAGLGYFLELWGTSRQCWTYYTRETPPLFAVLAHGMAAVGFWRGELLFKKLTERPSEKVQVCEETSSIQEPS